MSFLRDVETERVLAESQRIRQMITDAAAELNGFVVELDAYVERLHQMHTSNEGTSGDGEPGPRHADEPG